MKAMINRKCLYCYETIDNSKYEYHNNCSLKLFGNKKPTFLEFSLDKVDELAVQNINKRLAITGVQPKLSLELLEEKQNNRLTIVGLWGGYIFKPPYNKYPEMPEIEDLTMHLAEISGIRTSVHGLIRMQSGELGYITKRFDRSIDKDRINKIYTEDFCQLTETLTANKYNGSLEKLGKTIQNFSEYSGLDKLSFLELSLFCFLTGNTDMHLKNFSLYKNPYNEITLSPAYDLIASKLLIPSDEDESALTINGKKRNIRKEDFIALAVNMGIENKVIVNTFNKFGSKIDIYMELIEKGFISNKTKTIFKKLILEKAKVLGLK